MRARHFVLFAILLLAGAVGTVLVLPSASEVGLMRLKDKQFGSARAIYEKRIAKGDYSVDSVMPLVEIYMQYGETDRAIQLLERFTAHAQRSPDLMDAMGRLKRSAQKPVEYMRALEGSARLKHDTPSLRHLATLYRYYDQRNGLSDVLTRLADSGQATPAELFELAQTKAADGFAAQALEALRKLDAQVRGDIDDDTVQLWIRLLLDTGEAGKAFDKAKQYLSKHKNPHAARAYAAVFATSGRPQTGYQVLQLLPEFLTDAEYLKEWIEYEVRLGMREVAWKRLQERYQSGRLDVEVLSSFTELALERQQLEDAWRAGEMHSFAGLPRWLLANMAEVLFDGKRNDRLRVLLQSVGVDFLSERPLLGARVLLEKHDAARAVPYLRSAANSSNHTERLAAAELLLQVGQENEARSAISSADLQRVHPSAISTISDLYTRLNSANEGTERLARMGASKPGHKLFAPWVLLMLAAGKDQQASAALNETEPQQLPVSLWRDVFYVAQDHRCLESTVTAARRLVLLAPSDDTGLMLAQALLASGRFAEALPIFRSQRRKSADAEDGYVAALVGAAGANPIEAPPDLQVELQEHWTAELQSGERQQEAVYGLLSLGRHELVLPLLQSWATKDSQHIPLFLETAGKAGQKQLAIDFVHAQLRAWPVDHKQYEELVWWLIDAAGKPAAEPYILQLAERGAETWIEAASELLMEAKRSDEARSLLVNAASRPGLSETAKTRIAYQLLDLGAKDLAAHLLFAQVQNAKPDDSRARDLVHLVSAKPGEHHVEWLRSRAAASQGQERLLWFEHLVQVAAHDAVVALVREPAKESDKTLAIALRSASTIGSKPDVERFAGALLKRNLRPEDLRELARLLSGPGSEALAEQAWTRLLGRMKHDAEAMRWLGHHAVSRGQQNTALEHFAALARLRLHDPASALAYAELLRERREPVAAREQYETALRAAESATVSPEAPGIRAYALFRLGQGQRAFATYEGLRAQGKLDVELRADYAALLMEAGEGTRALALLRDRPGSDVWHMRSRLLEAELLAAELKAREALEHVQRTMQQSGREPEALSVAASVEERLGRTQAALAYIAEAMQKEPDNGSIRRAWSDLRLMHGSRIGVDTERRSISGLQDQFWTSVASTLRLSDSVAAIFRMTGVNYSEHGNTWNATRRFGEIGAEWRGFDGWTVQGTASATGQVVGVSGQAARADERGRTEFRAEWGKPFWEVAELLSYGGVRDAVEVERSYLLTPGTSVRGIAGVRQYREPAGVTSARTWGVTGAVQQRLTPRGLLGVEYILDSERIRASRGVPLISSREVHSGSVNVQKTIWKVIQLHGAAGMAADRLGSNGPFWSIDGAYQPRRGVRLDIFFDRRRYRQSIDRDALRFGGGLTWRF